MTLRADPEAEELQPYSAIATSFSAPLTFLSLTFPPITLFLSTFFRSLFDPFPEPFVRLTSLRSIGFIRSFFLSSCEGFLRSSIHCGTSQPEARITLTTLWGNAISDIERG